MYSIYIYIYVYIHIYIYIHKYTYLYLSNITYDFVGNTGSLRFMAPEVALGKAYNEKVDVYSFAVIVWSIATNKAPFKGYDRSMHRSRVVLGI
jgi:serine/threonine protein kinase